MMGKSGLIQFLGTLIAAGALFLNIPLPEASHARESLISLQFIWMMIINFSVLLLFVMALVWFLKTENTLGKKFRFNAAEMMSFPFFGLTLLLLFYLWNYTLHTFGGTAGITVYLLGMILLGTVYRFVERATTVFVYKRTKLMPILALAKGFIFSLFTTTAAVLYLIFFQTISLSWLPIFFLWIFIGTTSFAIEWLGLIFAEYVARNKERKPLLYSFVFDEDHSAKED